jgi:hypothetical protein
MLRGTGAAHPARPGSSTRLVNLGPPGVIGIPCTRRGVPGVVIHFQRVARDGRVVADFTTCVTPPQPGGPPRVTDQQFAEQVQAAVSWPAVDIGAEPGARFLVGVPVGFFSALPAAVTVGPVQLSDGTTATGTARLVGVEWWVQGSFVATSGGGGARSAPALGFGWTTSGPKGVDARPIYWAQLTVTAPDGSIEQRDLDPPSLFGSRELPLEQIQAVIDRDP